MARVNRSRRVSAEEGISGWYGGTLKSKPSSYARSRCRRVHRWRRELIEIGMSIEPARTGVWKPLPLDMPSILAFLVGEQTQP